MQRSLKLPQVQYINKIIQEVQQITEVSQQQYMDMNVDVPAEIQCQSTATHQNIVKDAQVQRQMQMIQKMPSEIHRKSRTSEANHGVVNYHKVTLEESETKPLSKSQW